MTDTTTKPDDLECNLKIKPISERLIQQKEKQISDAIALRNQQQNYRQGGGRDLDDTDEEELAEEDIVTN